MVTTEIATSPLRSGVSIEDSDANGASVLRDVVALLLKIDGYQNLHFGAPVESPGDLMMLIDWDSRQDHEAFAASETYQTVLDREGDAVDCSKGTFHHVDFEPIGSKAKVVSAPVTGITTFYCDGAPGANWLSDAAKAAELMGRDSASTGFMGISYGITHEELSREGVKGKAAVVLVGWKSDEARTAFRQTETFQECVGLLKGEAKAIDTLHVMLKKPVQ